jgi:ribonuclease III
MFRLLKILLSPRSTSHTSPVVPTGAASQDDGRVAVATKVTFDSDEFTRRTGYHVRHEKYFLQAVIHRSYLQLCPPGFTQSNERMEFLGDSILNLVVTEHLYAAFPEAEEGELSRLRSRLVSRTTLAECARRLELQDFLLMSPSAHQAVRSGGESILIDAVEAFVAGIYLDGGYKAARTFVEDQIIKLFPVARMTLDENFKSRLLEYSQGRGLGIPRYLTIDESGPDHNPVFTVEVQVSGIPVGKGQGGSKKAAEQIAAMNALEFFREQDQAATAT